MNWKIILSLCALMALATTYDAAAAKQCRSSVTGKMVSSSYAKLHPKTTQCAERK